MSASNCDCPIEATLEIGNDLIGCPHGWGSVGTCCCDASPCTSTDYEGQGAGSCCDYWPDYKPKNLKAHRPTECDCEIEPLNQNEITDDFEKLRQRINASMIRPVTRTDVQAFLDRMDRDMAEANEIVAVETRLLDAIEDYERVFKVKIKMPLSLDT